jgi:hypothetical protein
MLQARTPHQEFALEVIIFYYLGTTITNQNLIQEEIKRRLNSGNACYYSVHTFVFSSAV